MHPRRPHALLHGLAGGFAAGALVALWFLFVDLAGGVVLRTPALLGSILLGVDLGPTDSRLVLAYTVLHFGVFGLLGMITAWLLAVTGGAPSVRLGILFGVGVLDSVYYTALLTTGANVLTVLPPGHVLGANLLGGIALMGYLHRAFHAAPGFGLGALRYHPLLSEGIIIGLIGAGTAGLWFLVLDVLLGEPFFTPAALGSLVFLGATARDQVQVVPGVVAAYAMLHLAAFVAVGTAAAWSARALERTPGLWLVWGLALVVLEGLFLGVVGTLGEWVLGAVGWWSILLANLLAVIAMGWRLRAAHPDLSRRLVEQPVDTKV